MCQNKVPVTTKDGRTVYVPCGKCEDCLEHKQKEFMVRAYRAAVYFGSMHLVTLSYDDDKIPVSGCTCQFDGDSVTCVSSPFYLDSELRQYFMEKAPVGIYYDSRGRVHQYRKPFFAPCVKEFGDDLRLFMSYAIRKSDVQSMIKKFRICYERKNGKLPNWKYVVIPELGGQTARPHYHMLVFGLSTWTTRMMCSYWNNGFTQVKKVNHINDDKSDGFSKVSAYVSKYVSKGDFEHKWILDGRSFKPRITASKFLGLEDHDYIRSVRSFCLGFDVFGQQYSVTEPFVAPREFVDDTTGEYGRISVYINSKVKPTLEAISRRMYININEFHYPLPFSFKNVIYKVYDPLKKRYTASSLSHAIMDYMEAVVADSIQREFESLEVDFPSEATASAFCEIANRNKMGDGTASDRAIERLRRFYQRQKVK